MHDAVAYGAIFLNFAGAAATVIKQEVDYTKFSDFSKRYRSVIVAAGFCASFVALTCLVLSYGWVLGIAIWFATGLVDALVAIQHIKWSDTFLMVAVMMSIVVGLLSLIGFAVIT